MAIPRTTRTKLKNVSSLNIADFSIPCSSCPCRRGETGTRADQLASFRMPALRMISRTVSRRLSNADTILSGAVYSQRALRSLTNLTNSGSFAAFSIADTESRRQLPSQLRRTEHEIGRLPAHVVTELAGRSAACRTAWGPLSPSDARNLTWPPSTMALRRTECRDAEFGVTARDLRHRHRARTRLRDRVHVEAGAGEERHRRDPPALPDARRRQRDLAGIGFLNAIASCTVLNVCLRSWWRRSGSGKTPHSRRAG